MLLLLHGSSRFQGLGPVADRVRAEPHELSHSASTNHCVRNQSSLCTADAFANAFGGLNFLLPMYNCRPEISCRSLAFSTARWAVSVASYIPRGSHNSGRSLQATDAQFSGAGHLATARRSTTSLAVGMGKPHRDRDMIAWTRWLNTNRESCGGGDGA
jgi:hypothetical protein